MATTTIVNTFDKGMFLDSLKYTQPPGTYRYARNMVRGSREDIFPGLSTEESTDKLHTYGSKIVAAYYVESLDGTVYFTADGSIHLFDHTKRTSTFVASDSEFGCDWGFQNCEWISATFKTDQPCSETKVYWSSGCEYYVVNIAEMLNPKRKAGLMASIKSNNNGSCGLNCEYFRLMKCVCSPTLTALMSDRGGHKLVSGTYQFVVQLEDNGGNTTNWFSVSDPVSVASENNQPGEMSLGSIKVHLTNLDCRYDKVNIAVIKTVQGIQTAQIVASRHYSTDGVTFTYVGQDEGKFVTLQEIQAKRKMFIRGKDVAQKDSRLFLYNIRQEKNLNMQRRVLDEGTITFIEIETTAKMVERHGMRTWERGENYLFAVVYNYCDGTHSAAFLLKPNGGGGGGAGSSSSMTSPSGKAQKTKRPRGNTNDSGGCYGCCTGKCGGCGAGGCAPAGGDTNGETPPNEDERVENRTKENVDEWDTDIADTVEAAKCDDCHEPYCCETDDEGNVTIITDPNNTNCDGCEKDEEQYEKDLPNIQDIVGTHTDEMIFGNQDLDPEYNAYTFKSASSALIESIDNSEYRVIEKDKFEIVITAASGSSPEPKTEGSQQDTPELAKGGGGSGFGESETTIPSNEATTTPRVTEWSDEYTDGAGIYLLDEVPTIVGEVAPEVVTSEELYPDSKDCNGEFLYGSDANTPVKLFRTPTADKSPIVVPTSSGVPSPHSSADPLQSVKIRLLGLKAVNIPMPRPEDLPKPLCPNNPYTIVSIARDEINSTVQAKGIMFGTFTGTANGEPYTYMRHGANSRCNVDRWVGSGMHASRKGGGAGPGYGFYGLDTAVGRVGLSGSKFRQELKMSGQGYRYGLFAKGTEPKDALTGRRSDQRGARQYISLNIPQPNFSEVTMAAVGYCDPNAVTEVSGATNKVSTLSRESCVYIEAPLSKDTDSSFTSDTLNHNCPIPDAYGLYGAVVRDIPDQYGSVTGMTFIKTGLEGRGFDKAYQGVCGDTFIGPYSFIRQGFVSDKVGDKFNTPERQRTVCDSPNDLLLQQMGIDFYTTQIPLSGDKSDAKNWAGGHRDEEWDAAFGHPPEHDLYYPKTQRTLITTWIESRINPYYRATGYGPAEDGDIFWPKTKGFYLDSAATITKHPWEKSFINQFIHYRVDQPSVAQLARKAIVKALINLILPMLFMDKLGELTGVVDGVATLLTSPILIAYWYTMKKLLSRDDYLDKMLGLPVCRTDSAGGEQDDNFIEGKQDNYHAYNYDHSALNYANVFPAMPALYNTCDCSLCLYAETDVVMADSSRKKIKDIQVGDLVSSYDFKNKEYVIKPVIRVINTGNQKVYRIKIKNNTYIDATANHKWFVKKRKQKEVVVVNTLELIENLKVNELKGYNHSKFRIATAPHYTPLYNNTNSNIITDDEAYILGIYIAEGHKYGGGVFISQYKKHIRDRIKEHLERTDFMWSETTNGFYISKLLAQHDLFLSVGTGACNKKLPEILFTQSLSVLLKLREGLMDGDGSTAEPSIINNTKREFYYTCSKQLEYDFRYLSFLVSKPGHTYSNLRSGFDSQSLQHTVHCHQNATANTGFLGIVSIEEYDTVPTYDIEVEDTHAFILADSGVITHNCLNDQTTNEIFYSNKQVQGSPIDFYKQFGALSYLEIPADSGKLNKLFNVNGDFYAHTSDFIIPIKFKDIGIATTVGTARLGGNMLLDDPTPLLEGVVEGAFGITDPNSGINTMFGWLWVDRSARKLYLFDGKSAVPISSRGMDRFFKEHMDFCELSSCHDEKNEAGTYYSLGYDPRFNRLLITKKEMKNEKSFTLSVDVSGENPEWISFHDYIPQAYVWDRSDLFSITNSEVHLHHAKEGSYRTFYGKEYPSEIEFVAVSDTESFVYENTFINTEAEKEQVRNLDDTFNRIAMYNTTQGTGTTEVTIFGDSRDAMADMSAPMTHDGKTKLFKIKRGFRFNNVFDNTKPACGKQAMTIRTKCIPIDEINEGRFDCSIHNKQNYSNNILSDDHLVYRMTYDNDNKTLLRLINVKTDVEKEIR